MKDWWKRPIAPGLRVVDMRDVPLKDLDGHAQPYKTDDGTWIVRNVIRAKGIDPSFVTQYANLIRDGLWDPYYYVPPVITIDNKIVAGEGRFVAHQDAGEKTMHCAICEFFEVDGKSAAYWQKMYQSNENAGRQREVQGNNRTEEDVIHLTTYMCQDDEMTDVWFDHEDDYRSIRTALKDQGYKDSKKINDLVEAIKIEGGHEAKAVKGYTNNRIKDEIASEMKKDSTLEQPNEIRVMESTSGFDPDYDNRITKEVTAHVLKCIKDGKFVPYTLLLYWKGLTAKQLPIAHEGKQDLFHNQYILSKKYVEVYENGLLEKYVDVKYKGQTSDEKVYSNFTPTMNYKQDYEPTK